MSSLPIACVSVCICQSNADCCYDFLSMILSLALSLCIQMQFSRGVVILDVGATLWRLMIG